MIVRLVTIKVRFCSGVNPTVELCTLDLPASPRCSRRFPCPVLVTVKNSLYLCLSESPVFVCSVLNLSICRNNSHDNSFIVVRHCLSRPAFPTESEDGHRRLLHNAVYAVACRTPPPPATVERFADELDDRNSGLLLSEQSVGRSSSGAPGESLSLPSALSTDGFARLAVVTDRTHWSDSIVDGSASVFSGENRWVTNIASTVTRKGSWHRSGKRFATDGNPSNRASIDINVDHDQTVNGNSFRENATQPLD